MNEREMLDLMSALDQGTNLFGSLGPDTRARIFEAVDNPCEETWQDVHGILLIGDPGRRFLTVWQALLRYTDYAVERGPTAGEPWSAVPTREQYLTALTAALK